MPVTAGARQTLTLPLFRRGAWRESLDTSDSGTRLRTALAPEIVIADDAKRVRGALPMPPFGDVASRRALLLRAIDRFADGELSIGDERLDRGDFHALLDDTAGLPPPLIDRWTSMLAGYARHAIPGPEAFTLVSLPGNTFTCLESVCDAVLGGGVVWIRPSRKEPLSAARFAAALLAAGWPPARLGFYATHPNVLRTLARVTDRQVIYGGASVAESMRGETAIVRGPGGSTVTVADGADVAALRDRVANDSGRFCTNVRVIVCTGDAATLAQALGSQLDEVPLRELAHFPDERSAHALAEELRSRVRPTDSIATRRPLVCREGGRTYLTPLLVHVGEPQRHPLVGREVPFPFAAIVARAPERAA